MHRDYAVRAARAGIHVLCEKPMAVTAAECAQMIQSARRGGVKLMIAYRLHFDEANMTAVQMLHSNKIGPPRLFNSTFTMQVRPGDIRVQRKFGRAGWPQRQRGRDDSWNYLPQRLALEPAEAGHSGECCSVKATT